MILIKIQFFIKILIVKFSGIFLCYYKMIFMVDVLLNVLMVIIKIKIIKDV